MTSVASAPAPGDPGTLPPWVNRGREDALDALDVPNPMLDRVYAAVGGNATLAVHPPVMHFGGYELGKVHAQRFTVTNVSAASKRIDVIDTSTAYFKTKFKKRGLLAPGMSETIEVQFCATEPRVRSISHWSPYDRVGEVNADP